MKVTVCEISDREDFFLHEWLDLNQHLIKNKPTLLLLPDLAFFEWTDYDALAKKHQLKAQLENQTSWIRQLEELAVRYVIYTKLVVQSGKYFKACFLYERKSGHKKIREVIIKDPMEGETPRRALLVGRECNFIEIEGFKIGVALDTELWRATLAEHVAQSDVDILLCPRASSKDSVEQWIRQGQTMAVLSGAYSLSSNKTRPSKTDFQWGGRGWIAEPFTGKLLGSTNNHKRFITVQLDIRKTREAKSKFPLNDAMNNF